MSIFLVKNCDGDVMMCDVVLIKNKYILNTQSKPEILHINITQSTCTYHYIFF